MTALVFVLATLAAWRVTLLISTDTITARPRAWLARRYPARVVPLTDDAGNPVAGSGTIQPRWMVELSRCDYCLGIWVGAAMMVFMHLVGQCNSWPLVLEGWGAMAAIVGLLSDVISRLSR